MSFAVTDQWDVVHLELVLGSPRGFPRREGWSPNVVPHIVLRNAFVLQ